MWCLPNQNCPHLVRGLGQGMEGLEQEPQTEGLEQGPETEGLLVRDYQMKGET